MWVMSVKATDSTLGTEFTMAGVIGACDPYIWVHGTEFCP